MGRGKRHLQRASALAETAPALRPLAQTAHADQPDHDAGVKGDASDTLAAPAERLTRLTPADIAKRLAESEALRPMQSPFERDKQAWKQKEREFTKRVSKELHDLVQEMASSDSSWRQFLAIYTRSPHYSPQNMLWAWAQLRKKGVEEDGLVLSESAWKALGRKIKPGLRRSYKSEEGQPAWDDTYAAEMMAPMIVSDRKGEGADKAAAQPQASQGSQQTGAARRNDSTKVIGFRVFDVYHQSATEPTAEGKGELPEPSWFQASGSDEDAGKLWADIERICDWQGLELEISEPDASRPVLAAGHASYEPVQKRLRVMRSDNMADQSAAALGALLEHFGPQGPAKSDDEVKTRVIARESAKYVLSSLYGLNSEQQSFPFLAELATDGKALKKVTNDVHHRVSEVLNFLDPVFKAKARGESELKQARQSRTSKRKGQKGRKPRANALAE